MLREVPASSRPAADGPRAAALERPEEALSDRQKRRLEPLGPGMAAIAWGLDRLNRAIMCGLFRLRVKGREHLPDRGPVVFTPNHVSYLDPPAVAAALDYLRLRQTYWAGATTVVFHDPLLYLICRLAQVVPIDREHPVASTLAFGAAVLKRGKNLIWFPEGQRSPDGELQPFKPGIGMLLAHYPMKVVPVFIQGTREAMPPGRFLPRRAQITVVFGEPLDPRDLDRQGRGDEPRDRIADALHDHVATLGRVATSASCISSTRVAGRLRLLVPAEEAHPAPEEPPAAPEEAPEPPGEPPKAPRKPKAPGEPPKAPGEAPKVTVRYRATQ